MKKIFIAMLLVAAVTAVAQTPPAPAAPAQAPAAPAQQKKEIKDPAEYNAYVGAVQQTDPAAKVSGLEAFTMQYPHSVMKEDALEALMSAYQQLLSQAKTPDQQTLNRTKMLDTAGKVLQVNPCNLRALAVMVFTKQSLAMAGQNSQANFADAGENAEKGLQCLQTNLPRPEGITADEWEKLKTQTKLIFNGAEGISAYQAAVSANQAKDTATAGKDFAKAQPFLKAALEADPNNLVDVYDLALSDLAPGPGENDVEGLFFIARASNLAQGDGKTKIAQFGKSRYAKYHGSEDGWNDVLTMTATTPLPPANFTIAKYVPPTPAQQCTDLLKSKKVEEMSFAEWQLCLSEGAPDDADKVWSVLKGKPLQMVAHVITIEAASKPTHLTLAGSSDDIDAKRADIDLTMSAVIPAKDMPKEDTDFQFQGTPVSYVAKPFMMTMNDGALLVAAKPKPTVRRKPRPQ
ncbi:MAG: hypothetical protein WB566_13095 [Terriglobales bacterium]